MNISVDTFLDHDGGGCIGLFEQKHTHKPSWRDEIEAFGTEVDQGDGRGFQPVDDDPIDDAFMDELYERATQSLAVHHSPLNTDEARIRRKCPTMTFTNCRVWFYLIQPPEADTAILAKEQRAITDKHRKALTKKRKASSEKLKKRVNQKRRR
tara:strand:+ start:4408 stop:4866 length:459 start_codon:yes stop_codon:yes gene_type:complete